MKHWIEIAKPPNRGKLEQKSRSNQKGGRNTWCSTKEYCQNLSPTSNETANQNLRENQAANSLNDTQNYIAMKNWIEIAKPPNPKLDGKDQNQICLVGTRIEMESCK